MHHRRGGKAHGGFTVYCFLLLEIMEIPQPPKVVEMVTIGSSDSEREPDARQATALKISISNANSNDPLKDIKDVCLSGDIYWGGDHLTYRIGPFPDS